MTRNVRVSPVLRWRGAVVLLWVLLLTSSWGLAAEQFTGQVVGLSDGDTLSVLREGKAVKVRLHGIDTPERQQAFGTQARQVASALAFQQTVTVLVIQPADRYGRVVGDVLLPDGRSLNQELVRVGMAWWYRQYAPKDTALRHLEAEARQAKQGLWADAQPIAPWEWRREPRGPSQGKTSGAGDTAEPIVGNANSHVYHWPGCPGYRKVSEKHRVLFPHREAAEHAGYRAAGNCR